MGKDFNRKGRKGAKIFWGYEYPDYRPLDIIRTLIFPVYLCPFAAFAIKIFASLRLCD